METRARVVSSLIEGNSIRATERMTGVAKSTILRLGLDVGEGCARIHNRVVRGLTCEDVECDETWSFIAKKERRVVQGDPEEWGDVYTFIGFDRRTKLVIAYRAGKRDQVTTDAFIADLRARLLVVPQISTDGLATYVGAVSASFGGHVQYGQVQKQYGYSRSPDHRYEPARDANFIRKSSIIGAPDAARVSTSGVERLNLTLRHTVGRTRRLCLAFSKTMRGHRAAMSLGIAAYNFCKIHGAHRVTPAIEAGLVDRVWEIEELIEAALSEPEGYAPVPQHLTLPAQTGPVRELPSGAGFLRLVRGGEVPPAPSVPSPPPPAPRGGKKPGRAPEPTSSPVPSGGEQLDLLLWRRPERAPEQLSLPFPERDGGPGAPDV
ncbi:IS1 family transposase [Polyangium spumosum]|nr:IS1 family transposase [Polyangium spumosum]